MNESVANERKPSSEDAAEKPYRILLPLSRAQHFPSMLRLAAALTRARRGELVILHVIVPDQPGVEAGSVLSQEECELLEGVPYEVVTIHTETVAEGILEMANKRACNLILLAWRGRRHGLRNKLGQILDPVVQDAPCDVILFKSDPGAADALSAPRILLVMEDRHHTVRAVDLALALAHYTGGSVSFISAAPEDAAPDAEAKASEELEQLLSKVEPEYTGVPVLPQVIRAKNVLQAVTDAAKGHDLAVLTASGDTILNQLFAGSTADRLAEELTLPVIVVKRYRGLTQRWLRRVWRSIDALLPSLTDEDQIDVYKRVRRGARGTIDFYTLLLLAVVIATMGLLLNSGAVIIGAMLVAPLMTPILAIGLGVVMGDLRLLRVAAESTVRGIILALLVSILLTWIAPFVMFTTEITARTQPNLFDLTVALAAGGAGAYGISRKHIAAALSGVAVAAALVPPLSVVGICIATGRWPAASGAALLFGTNLVAISLAAAVIYLLLGFFPQAEDQKRHLVLRYGFLSSLLLLFALTLPLARSLEQDATRATTNQALRDALEQVLSEETNLSLFNFDWEAAPGQPIFLKVIVYARDEVTVGTLDAIEDATSSATGREVNVQLVIIPTDELRETDTTR